MKELLGLNSILPPEFQQMLKEAEEEKRKRKQYPHIMAREPSTALPKLTIPNKLPTQILQTIGKESPVVKEISVVRYTTQYYLDKLITNHGGMNETKTQAKRLSTTKDTVLISGPTGTGKELIARALHGERMGEFIPVNCGGFHQHLIDSILFGHVRGSFTGADRDHTGVFLSAQNGTVFLDEVSEIPNYMQAKLLRVLQEFEITPLGSSKTYKTTARIICATNQDLLERVNNGQFREDLYWRISTFILKTYPLIERPEDIDLYLALNNIKLDADNYVKLKDNVISSNGNYRALQHYIRRYQVFGTVLA